MCRLCCILFDLPNYLFLTLPALTWLCCDALGNLTAFGKTDGQIVHQPACVVIKLTLLALVLLLDLCLNSDTRPYLVYKNNVEKLGVSDCLKHVKWVMVSKAKTESVGKTAPSLGIIFKWNEKCGVFCFVWLFVFFQFPVRSKRRGSLRWGKCQRSHPFPVKHLQRNPTCHHVTL